MNGANVYHIKFGNLETIKWRHILIPRSTWLQFKRNPSSYFNSRFWVYYWS